MFAGAMDTAHHLKGGVTYLLEAIARLNDPRIVVILVGGGDKISTYEAISQKLGISAQVRFSGWVPHDAMSHYYAIADIVVQPLLLSLWYGSH
jgi:glycosyltransferase involved in cell wall biosynthesis